MNQNGGGIDQKQNIAAARQIPGCRYCYLQICTYNYKIN